MLPEFEAGVIGMKEGESKDVEVSFPADYHGKDVAGKTAVFTITVKNVAEAILPEIDADFAKALGITDGDVSKLRAEIEKNVKREIARRLAARNKEAVMQVLIDANPLELPQSLVMMEISRLMHQAKQDLAQRGMDVKSLPDLPADLFRDQAARRVALGLILAELVKANELKASPEQIKARVEEWADSYEHPEEVVKWYYESPERLEGPENLVLEDNVVEFVLSQAKVNEKAVSFDELMGNA